ncbi:hypothetical protein K431DRAFT_317551 [Polychaeton citri CBS 116435]|uniref:C2H2-type domain-containing protein n=1 Tax=Polychaeton citri CBS 116435 TaxID=1314669 RepID=A0A9P4QE37_9PEZI|nr:hypothetical protein K431DRAFT_317551 [Polychaeton citri CBS 116435]
MATAAQTSTPHTDPSAHLDPNTPQIALAHDIVSNTLPANPARRGDPTSTEPSPKSLKPRLAHSVSPVTLTGAAAMAELKRRKQQQDSETSRQTSPNPAVEAMQSLMGNGGMSRASDAPAPDKLSEPVRQVAEKISMPENGSGDTTQPSPTSVVSFATNDSAAAGSAMTATASDASNPGQQFVAEPDQIGQDSYPPTNSSLAPGHDADGNKAYSYPGPPPTDPNEGTGPSRGMSLPGYGHGSPKSPASNKRHKCPYCSTDFTRHHNLKSHLLTHSQEKPYVCQTCNARFRRLHDLKRHTKLHTGERPHTCDKCGRRFARGDALARHNKGPGGCAGRRSSFGGDDDYGVEGGVGEGMDGVEYTGEDDEEPSNQGRRVSEPSRKRAHLETSQDSGREVYRQHSMTYPPPAQQNKSGSSTGSMAPPQVIHPGSSSTTSPRDMSSQHSPGLSNGQVYTQQSAMIESPKPLSPGQTSDQHRLSVPDIQSHSLNRNRSPSLTAQFQQVHYGRGGSRNTPPFGQPPSSQQPSQQQQQQPGPQLPVLPALAPTGQTNANPRPAMQPSAVPSGPGPSMLHHGQIPPVSGHNSATGGSGSSHGQSSTTSLRDALGHEQSDIWGYVRSLEQRFSRMQDEYELRISRLQEDVIGLRNQVSSSVAVAAGAYANEHGLGQAQGQRY